MLSNFTNGARILGVFLTPSISHQVTFQPIYKELSLRGHQVTVVTPNPLNEPNLINLTEIDVGYLYRYGTDPLLDLGYKDLMRAFNKIFHILAETVFNDANLKNIYQNTSSEFDLILLEPFSPVFYGLSGKYNAPAIGILSLEGFLNNHNSVGSPTHPALFGDCIISFHEKPTIVQKIYNTYYFLWYKFFYEMEVLPPADALVKRYLGNDIPYLGDLEKNVSMIFMNTNFILHPVRPIVPSMIQLQFMHIKTPKPLPLDLQDILERATKGAIYFSLGSNVKSSNLAKKTLDVIIEALSEVPYTVLWKWESDDIPGISSNVVTRKWFPQQDILAHPNIKAFITQGGIQSAEELIFRGVPIVGMPFFGDQPANVKILVKQGIGVAVDHSTMTKDEFKNAIIDVAENDKYKKRVKDLSDTVKDQPMTGLEKAVWWTEYVIRHKGASHLRSRTADIPLYEYLLLDVIAVVVGILLIAVYIIVKTFKFLVGSRNLNVKMKTT